MSDFETHPVGTGAELERLREIEKAARTYVDVSVEGIDDCDYAFDRLYDALNTGDDHAKD